MPAQQQNLHLSTSGPFWVVQFVNCISSAVIGKIIRQKRQILLHVEHFVEHFTLLFTVLVGLEGIKLYLKINLKFEG